MSNKTVKNKIPTPPHPFLRKNKLPWESTKATEEDESAATRQKKLTHTPSYLLADEDIDFLQCDEVRGVRLQLDYSKAELLLRQHKVEHTIVAFGSARIMEPNAARRELDQLLQEKSQSPDNPDLKRKIKVARQRLASSHYYKVARDFGRLVADSGNGPGDNRVVLMTGGGPGMMEAANRGAYDAGAETIGLNILLPHEQYPNPYITDELCFRFHYFAIRKMHFLLRAKALVAFPGGFGTLDELFETLTLVQTRKVAPLPIILMGESYWRNAVNFEFLAEQGVIDDEDLDLFWFAETALEAWEGILKWHQANHSPLFE